MTSPKTIRSIVGVIGNIISFYLFLSPCFTFWRIIKKKDVEEFQYYPYVATVLNCLLWVYYGSPLVITDGVLVVSINAIGLVIELIYLSIFCLYDHKGKGRKRVALGLLVEVVFMGIIVGITMTAVHSHKTRTYIVGIFCDIFNIIMYGSPLGIMKKVITTKSVEFMPFNLSLANFLNGSCWTAYALIYKFDIFLLVSNGLGAISGAVQLILYACYYKSTPKEVQGASGDVEKPSEIQLSGGSNRASSMV